jgi:hypothetical protein
MMDSEDRVAARFMRKRGKSYASIQAYMGYPMPEIVEACKGVEVGGRKVRDIGPAIGFEENGERRTRAEDANFMFLTAIRQSMGQGQSPAPSRTWITA